MNLSEMRQVLASGQMRLTKSLGQNFLHDGNQLRRIVAAAALSPTDKVLEIGPGLGPLTELLLADAGQVLAIEKDRRLCEFLEQHFTAETKLTLLHDDALEFLRRESRDWSQWKLVANLPYSVASPILVELAWAESPPERLVATLQLEVARRLVAVAGDDDYGVLSLLVQLSYAPKQLVNIPAACFFPMPAVDSACVTLVHRERPLLQANLRETFYRLVKLSFSQRRKMMLKLLKPHWAIEDLQQGFMHVEIDPQIRAEQVTLEQFVRLTKYLTQPH
ncbi:MAG: ribosomal RNA small subunit methyltransferase A [Verrucomicrobia bacterium]|nr:ribosomal RNA small subunit methyltransferase A [Verrucomicrobiota bacterium]